MLWAPSTSCGFLPFSLCLPYWTVTLGDQEQYLSSLYSQGLVWYWEIMATQYPFNGQMGGCLL